jgi:diguanylate cyclase
LTDELTGLPHRRAWDERLAREFERSRRFGRPLHVALFDIDDFRGLNERCGHPAGDEALKEIARAWRTLLDDDDLPARYGGDELAVALAGRPIEAEFALVERLRTAMPAGLTCSAGLASLTDDESADGLLARAHGVVYEAKRGGGDAIVIAP